MAEHRALRSASGATGIEEPRHVVRFALNHVDWFAESNPRVLRATHRDGRKLSIGRSHGLRQILGHEADLRTTVLENVRELAGMKFRVDRDRHQPAVPDREEQLEIARMIVQDERDAIAGA